MDNGTSTDTKWVYDSPVHSDVEAKLRRFLVELGNANKILGIQVCAYKDGKVIIDTAAGVMGTDDPRPVQPDTLFPVFSATKGVTAGMIHWLADKGILKLDDNVAKFWPEFAVNGKDQIKVHHILNHTSGLHDALPGITKDHVSFCNWEECLKRIAMAKPETEPGREQFYHYVSYGWLCGGIIEVCAYKDGQVIIDTAAGVMGTDDPRPVQLDTLFPVFSATKGVTAGMIHWLADKGILKLDDNVAKFWPEFAVNGKDQIKVHHILNHTSGLQDALSGITEDHVSFCNWEECVKRIAMAKPETEPGHEQFYHYLSYGWLCGGIIERASGKKFKDVLEEAFVRPLNLEGELYIGIPPGVESRLVTSRFDTSEFTRPPPPTATSPVDKQAYAAMPTSLSPAVFPALVSLTNMLDVRRTIQPAGNGNFTARALARYYAALVDGGTIPSPHPSTTDSHTTEVTVVSKIFNNPKSEIHDAFLGTGDYKDLALPDGKFGLGFKRIKSTEGLVIGFGHSGLGGSTGYGDINNRFSISVMINKMSFTALATAVVIRFVCSELDLPVPEDYAGSREFNEKPVIN